MSKVNARGIDGTIVAELCPSGRLCHNGRGFCEHLEAYLVYPPDTGAATEYDVLVECKEETTKEGSKTT